jgi:hypothetical protein
MALPSGTRLGPYEIQAAVGEHDGIAYLVMQYLDGETLAATLTKGPLPLERALRGPCLWRSRSDRDHALHVRPAARYYLSQAD